MRSEKNAINVEKNQRSCIFTIIFRWHICQNVTNSAVMLYLSKRYKRYKRYTFLSLRHVCAYIYYNTPPLRYIPPNLSFKHMEKWHIKYRKVGS